MRAELTRNIDREKEAIVQFLVARSNTNDRMVKSTVLAQFNGTTVRVVRRAVHELRIAGIPICSDTTNGYWYAASEAEATTCAKILANRAWEILKAAKGMKWSAKDANQTALF